jgi:hypothetical protein
MGSDNRISYLGVIIALIDRGAGMSLADGNWLTFACWYLPGAAFLQVGGSFVEVTAGAAAALAAAALVKWLVTLGRREDGRKREPSRL